MADREHLIQRYSDLLEPDVDADLLPVVALLDDAAAPYRRMEPPAKLDAAVLGLTRQRRAASGNEHVASPTNLDTSAAPAMPSRVVTRLRTGLRQSLGMVAAVLVLVLVAGVLAVTFGNLGQSQQGGIGGGTGTPTPSGYPFSTSPRSLDIRTSSACGSVLRRPANLAAVIRRGAGCRYRAAQRFDTPANPDPGNHTLLRSGRSEKTDAAAD